MLGFLYTDFQQSKTLVKPVVPVDLAAFPLFKCD
jgi:hypothetical protein